MRGLWGKERVQAVNQVFYILCGKYQTKDREARAYVCREEKKKFKTDHHCNANDE